MTTSQSRTYSRVFKNLDRPALIPFFVIGDPDFDTSLELVSTAIDAGADILELGIPFSDPIADGPTIQKADIRALSAGMTTARAIEFVGLVSKYKPIPIGLLVYYNLVFQYGLEKFFADFTSAGGSSVLVADLSIDDADEIAPQAIAAGLDTVFMVTPNTSQERIRRIAQKTTGFIYTVSTYGVTGARQELSSLIAPLVAKIKALTSIPVCVGFGISTPQQAAQVVAAGADGVIIGSAIVKLIEDNLSERDKIKPAVRDFISSVKAVL